MMNKSCKKTLSLVLFFVMLLTAVPFAGLTPVAEAKTYQRGDVIRYGGYPQSLVTDPAVVSALDATQKKWTSYGYYSGTGNWADGKMQAGDYMRYADLSLDGVKYRAVTFDTYRPKGAGLQTKATPEDSYQASNGYVCGKVYYFRYESLLWRVLDPAAGLVMSENVIDSQSYQNTVYYAYGDYWQDRSTSVYSNDYAASTVRAWLLNDFYNTAFSEAEQKGIAQTRLDNSSPYDRDYDSAVTTDRVFLLSFDEVRNTAYGFSSNTKARDDARKVKGTDYAKCQGLWLSVDPSFLGNSYFWLRSGASHSDFACYVDCDGCLYNLNNNVDFSSGGIRPAFRFASGITESQNPYGGGGYLVSYNANGGVKAPVARTKQENEAVTIAAELPEKTYTVTFNTDDGSSVTPGSKALGATFAGWNTAADGSGKSYAAGDAYTDNADVTLYAQWTDPQMGSLPTPTRPYSTFLGWQTADGRAVTETAVVRSNLTLYANWKEVPREKYPVSFHANGGVDAPAAQEKTQGIDLHLTQETPRRSYTVTWDLNGGTTAVPARTVACAFSGWNTHADGSGTAYQPGGVYRQNASLELYAQWDAAAVGALPTASRSLYTFDGWYTARSGGKKVTAQTQVTGNVTYFAHWSARPLAWSETFGFANADGNFHPDEYYIHPILLKKLEAHVKRLAPDKAGAIMNKIQKKINSEWSGSCYGMAVTCLLDRLDDIAFNEHFNAETMNHLEVPIENFGIESVINYYHLSQYLFSSTASEYFWPNDASHWKGGLKNIVELAKTGSPFLFCYGFSGGGHAIVIKGYNGYSGGVHTLSAYDNRFIGRSGNDITVTVSDDYSVCKVIAAGQVEVVNFFEYVADAHDRFSCIDVDGLGNTDFPLSENTAVIEIADGNATVTNDAGQTLRIENGVCTGDMDVLGFHVQTNETAEGEAETSYIVLVKNSKTFDFKPEKKKMEVSVMSADLFGAAKTDGADTVEISVTAGVSAQGEEPMTYELTVSVKDQQLDMVEVSGSTLKETVAIRPAESGVVASGVDEKEGKVTVFSDLLLTDVYSYLDGFDELKIEPKADGEKGEVSIFGVGTGEDAAVDIGSILGAFDCAIPGDLDDDGVISVADARLALRAAVGLEEYADNSRKFSAADVDEDGSVTAADARIILRAFMLFEGIRMGTVRIDSLDLDSLDLESLNIETIIG